jgi:hypothetical protein
VSPVQDSGTRLPHIPLISSLLRSNTQHKTNVPQFVKKKGKKLNFIGPCTKIMPGNRQLNKKSTLKAASETS